MVSSLLVLLKISDCFRKISPTAASLVVITYGRIPFGKRLTRMCMYASFIVGYWLSIREILYMCARVCANKKSNNEGADGKTLILSRTSSYDASLTEMSVFAKVGGGGIVCLFLVSCLRLGIGHRKLAERAPRHPLVSRT